MGPRPSGPGTRRSSLGLRGSLRFRGGRPAPLCAGLWSARPSRLPGLSRRLPSGPCADVGGFSRTGDVAVAGQKAAASRPRARLSRARQIGMGRELAQLRRPRRNGGYFAVPGGRRCRGGCSRRHLTRRAHHHGPLGSAPHPSARCRLERYRPRHRRQRTRPDQELCRQAAGAAQLRRRRRIAPQDVGRAIPTFHRGAMAKDGARHLARRRRKARVELRSAPHEDIGEHRPRDAAAGSVDLVRRVEERSRFSCCEDRIPTSCRRIRSTRCGAPIRTSTRSRCPTRATHPASTAISPSVSANSSRRSKPPRPPEPEPIAYPCAVSAFSTPRRIWSSSIDSNSALKLPSPNPSSPLR